MEDALIVIKETNIPALFQEDGSDPIIEGLKKEAAKFKGDITTLKGRKEIASFARKFSSAKVYLDGLGKSLSDEYRAKIAPINAERNKIEACCDELRDKVRKPLTEWEDTEKKRVADIEERIKLIQDRLYLDYEDSEDVKRMLDGTKEIVVDESFEEFELAATKAKDAAVTQLEAKFIVLQSKEKEKAEAERLEKERLENERIEREKKIAKEAAAKAKEEAETKAAQDAAEKELADKEEKGHLEKEKLQAQLDKEKAEREKRELEERAEREKKEALEKAERNKQEAVEAEKKRLEDEKKIAAEKESKRQANKRHQGTINREAKESFITAGLTEERAEEVVKMIVQGKIANITINY